MLKNKGRTGTEVSREQPAQLAALMARRRELLAQLKGNRQDLDQIRAAPKDALAKRRKAATQSELAQSSRQVLVVDEDPVFRSSVCQLVSSFGLGCQTAASGAEALQWIERADFDLVITDSHLEEMGGAQLPQRLRAIKPTIAVILMMAGLAQSTTSAVDRVLFKPFTSDQLRDAVAMAMPD